MFQNFTEPQRPDAGRTRLSALREVMKQRGLDGFLVPRADRFQGEKVADCDDRLAWLTGFTGSAGMGIALMRRAAVFVDSRYTLQVRDQIDLAVYEPVSVPATPPETWLADALKSGGRVGFDPWLHGRDTLAAMRKVLDAKGISLIACENLIDEIWHDRPAPPMGRIVVQADVNAGESHESKRKRLAADLRAAGLRAAILTSPESLAWLLNIRGADIVQTPVPHGWAILHDDDAVTLFIAAEKLSDAVRAHLGNRVSLSREQDFTAALADLHGPVALDPAAAPMQVGTVLEEAGIAVTWQADPCELPRAQKNETELQGAVAAHRRDGAAMAAFLCWLDSEAGSGVLTEIDVVTKLEAFRAEGGMLRDIAFDTICGAGPHGAVVHYRVTAASNRRIAAGDVLLVDSGAQYVDGTTDVTRTIAIGPVDAEATRAFTLVLKGMIGISRLLWPAALTGRDIDAVARLALWQHGLDYDHGTGHGVGAFLSVHEGPQGISRRSKSAFLPGMIVSNEPGYYREGAFGIRIENLLVVEPPATPPGGDREMLSFSTLTLVPIDRRMIVTSLLEAAEIEWLDNYHARVLAEIGPLVAEPTLEWLKQACAPLLVQG